MKETDNINIYFKQVEKYPLLKKEEEIRLGRLAQEGDIQARDTLINSNLRLVVKQAHFFKKKYPNNDLVDLIQEGNRALLHASGKFDPERGFKFTTYAIHWINAFMNEWVMKHSSLVRTRQTMNLDYSLDDLVSGNDQTQSHQDTFKDRLSDEGEWVESVSNKFINKEKLINTINILDDKEKSIIKTRYLSTDKVTLRELGIRYGVSRQRIQQIEASALQKMRKHLLSA